MAALKSLPLIDGEEVEKYLEFKPLFNALEAAFVNYSKGPEGGIVQPARGVVRIEEHDGWFGLMPAYSKLDDTLAAKLVSVYPNNHKKGLPSHLAHVLLYEAETGSLKAIIDGNSVTTIRTAVASAVATKHLANPNSKILAILGAGVQGRSHWKALCELYKFDEVRIWSRTKASSEKFATETGAKVCDTVDEATLNADIICTCTNSSEPVLFAKHVEDGAHVNGVGACRPTWQEMDPELMRKAFVIADSKEACMKESGDLVISKAEVYAEIGEIIAGKKAAPVDKITIFDSMGMAIEDVVSAKIIYEKFSAKK